MACRPVTPTHIVKAIRSIDHRFAMRWNGMKDNWEIWYRPEGRAPYMFMRVQNSDQSYRPLDQRTVSHIRYMVWFNREIVRNLYEQQKAEEYAAQTRQEQEADETYRIGLDIHPAVDAFQRAHGLAHSAKPRVHVPGIGTPATGAMA